MIKIYYTRFILTLRAVAAFARMRASDTGHPPLFPPFLSPPSFPILTLLPRSGSRFAIQTYNTPSTRPLLGVF